MVDTGEPFPQPEGSLPPARAPKSELERVGKEFYEKMAVLLRDEPVKTQSTVVHGDGSNTFDPHYERGFNNAGNEHVRISATSIEGGQPITVTHTLATEKVDPPPLDPKSKISMELWEKIKGRRTYYDIYTVNPDGSIQALRRRLDGSSSTYETQPLDLDPNDLLKKIANTFVNNGPEKVDPDVLVRPDAEVHAKWQPNHPQTLIYSLSEPHLPVKVV